MSKLIRAACSIPGCGHHRCFTVQVEKGAVAIATERILLAAGWLRPNGKWTCHRCAGAVLAARRYGSLTLEQAVAVESAVLEAEALLRIEVR